MGRINSSQSQMSPLHLFQSLHGLLPWLQLMTLLLVLILYIACRVIASRSSWNLVFFWQPIPYGKWNIFQPGKQSSQHVSFAFSSLLSLLSPIKNGTNTCWQFGFQKLILQLCNGSRTGLSFTWLSNEWPGYQYHWFINSCTTSS